MITDNCSFFSRLFINFFILYPFLNRYAIAAYRRRRRRRSHDLRTAVAAPLFTDPGHVFDIIITLYYIIIIQVQYGRGPVFSIIVKRNKSMAIRAR